MGCSCKQIIHFYTEQQIDNTALIFTVRIFYF